MKDKKAFASVFITLIISLFTAGVAAAAPDGGALPQTAVFFSEAVNLPGWVGGVLTLLALILPLAVSRWMRQK